MGNLHLELMAEATRLLTPDDRAVRQLLERILVPFRETRAVFRAGRFARGETLVATTKTDSVGGVVAVELGQSHKH